MCQLTNRGVSGSQHPDPVYRGEGKGVADLQFPLSRANGFDFHEAGGVAVEAVLDSFLGKFFRGADVRDIHVRSTSGKA